MLSCRPRWQWPPCPPALTELLHAHLAEFGVQPDGRLFVGERNGGVPPTTVAEWAGHSVEVLLRIYAKCLDGGDALVRRRVEAALGHADTDNSEVTGSNPLTPTV